jgi:hypothetical protein
LRPGKRSSRTPRSPFLLPLDHFIEFPITDPVATPEDKLVVEIFVPVK